jgi:hypothetical protein
MRTTSLLAIVFIIAFATVVILVFATAASAGPRGDPYWQPCDYGSNWKIGGTGCG